MGVLFEIIPKRDYCIAKFTVERDYVLSWEDIILCLPRDLPRDIDLPKGTPIIKTEAINNNFHYIITMFASYNTCLELFTLFKEHREKPFITPKPFDEQQPFYKELGFETQEDYESYSCLEECINSQEFNSIGYSHISYEAYICDYE